MSPEGLMEKVDQVGKVDLEAKEEKMAKTNINKKSGSSRELMLQMAIWADLDRKDTKAKRGKKEKLNTP